MQNHYNLLYREEEREMLPLCGSESIGVIPWSPLARGLLAGTRSTVRRESDAYSKQLYGRTAEADQNVIARVQNTATRRGVPPAQIALAWLLHQPTVTSPIVGASKPGHLEDAVAALQLKLTPQELSFLEEPYVPHPVAGLE